MVIVLRSDADAAELDEVVRSVEAAGGTPLLARGVARTIVGVIGDEPVLTQLEALVLPGVAEIIRVTSPYKLVSREHHAARTVVEVGPAGMTVAIGADTLTLIAGPCAVETPEQTLEAARMAKAAGARLLRGGAYKPRTSPYAFQGLGEAGLRILAEAKAETGLPIVTELMDARDLDAVLEVADVIQIGARNRQNYTLLTELGRAGRPVLLKRGLSATLEDLLRAAGS